MGNQAGMKLYPCHTFCNKPKCWDKQAWANSVDPDQMLQNMSRVERKTSVSQMVVFPQT